MGFDQAWFDELRTIDAIKIQKTRLQGIDHFVPHVGELLGDGHISYRFFQETNDLNMALNSTPYELDRFFRVYERHICNFPRGKAFRKQWNIGFHAGENSEEDGIRIGIGFRLSISEKLNNATMEYLEYRELIKERADDFDRVFGSFGNYGEPDNIFRNGQLSQEIIDDSHNAEDWRFFGKYLYHNSIHDRKIIESTSLLVREIVSVFDHIKTNGFGQ
jgi:hypothetical protein